MPSLSDFERTQPFFLSDRWQRLKVALEPVLAATIFMLAVALASRFWEVYQYNPDEGFNLMKSALVMSGYPLYSEIWSDQPPVFTYLLVPLQWLSPGNVDASRILVLLFAGWIIFSLFRIVRRTHGRDAAWIAVLSLAAASKFASISSFVLIGLPAVAFAFAGLDLLLAASKLRHFLIAGLRVALGLQTKLFVALKLPSILLAPWVRATDPDTCRQALINSIVLILAVILAFLAIGFISGEAFFQQLIQPHTAARANEHYEAAGGFRIVWNSLSPQLVLALVPLALLAIARTRLREDALPLVWLAIALPVLLLHRPYWAHQSIMILVPAAWLCGISLSAFRDARYRRFAFCALTVMLGGLAAWTMNSLRPGDAGNPVQVSPIRRDHREFRSWAVADFVMDAYRGMWLTPPELAVLSEKRVLSGNLTVEYLGNLIDRYKPDEIFLRRFNPTPEMVLYLQNEYRIMPVQGAYLHAVRKHPD